jgi:RNA polymerase sigma factor (sigma-70 family)
MKLRQDAMTKGDPWVQELYRQYATAIFSYLRLHTSSPEDAEDILLEIFLQVLESDVFVTLSADKQRAWLYSTARHKIVDRYRDGARHQFIDLERVTTTLYESDEHAPEQTALQREEIEHLRSLVQRLPPVQQEILHLRFANALRCSEIAALLGKPEESVRSLLSRALNTLRSIYNN